MKDANASDACPQRIYDWLSEGIDRGASDLHLVAGHAPIVRLHGNLHQLDYPSLDSATLESMLRHLPSVSQWQDFETTNNLDFAYRLAIGDQSHRCRINYFRAGNDLGACIRIIPATIPSFEWAGFPAQLADQLTNFRNGLVLVAGVTGAGKSTTLAMLVDLLKGRGGKRIITVEEPIEYVFARDCESVVTQREVGEDVASFADGLKYGLRQDPDVMLVGEIRDRDTAQMTLSAAETGHLVFSTLHTRDAKGAISRYADLFPQSVQEEIRSQLSMSLRAVVSQHLLPSSEPNAKRELALEVMFNNAPIASAIRSARLETIDNNILTGKSDGMVTLNESIKRLLQQGRISQDTAEQFVTDRGYLLR